MHVCEIYEQNSVLLHCSNSVQFSPWFLVLIENELVGMMEWKYIQLYCCASSKTDINKTRFRIVKLLYAQDKYQKKYHHYSMRYCTYGNQSELSVYLYISMIFCVFVRSIWSSFQSTWFRRVSTGFNWAYCGCPSPSD